MGAFSWEGYRFHRILEVPRPPEPRGEDRTNAVLGVLAAALGGSHAALLASGPDSGLVASWLHSPWDQQVHVLVGGRPFFPPAVNAGGVGSRPILFPPGASGTDVDQHDAELLLGAFPYWVRCAARPDSLWAPGTDRRPLPTLRRGGFDRYAAHWGAPFAWLVLASPLPADALQPELDALVAEILPLSRSEVGEERRLQLERKQARHRELSRAQHDGGWRVRVLVGGLEPRSTSAAAALLCAAAELEGMPYTLSPAANAATFSHALAAGVEGVRGQTVFTATTELVAALTRPPERELPGLRVVLPRTFDLTPENRAADGVQVGQVVDAVGQRLADLRLSHAALNRHTFVCGATGAGKSMTIRHLLTEASRDGIPWLVIEPAKAEYQLMGARIAELGRDVVVIRPGTPTAAPAGFNPLQPAPGFPLQTHADLVGALFLAAFEANEPFPQILRSSLVQSYEELGWDLSISAPSVPGRELSYPTLGDLQRVAARVVSEVGYGREVAADVHGFIRVRLGALRLGTTGRFFEGGHPIDFDRLLQRNVVLQIEDVGDDADKAFFMGAVLIRLTEQLRMSAKGTGRRLTHLTVIEEAHRLLRRSEPGRPGAGAHAVEMFANLLAEVRSYGEGLVIAEQIPSKLTPDVIKNTAVKIVHRLPARDDRDSVGATMNLDDAQSAQVVALRPGEAVVYADGMDRPMLIAVPDGTNAEGGGGSLADVDALIGRRSGTCGNECRERPCTLLDLAAAQHLLATNSWLRLWAELVVLAHLTGRAGPNVAPQWVGIIKAGTTPRVLECSISHAVDDAVAVRGFGLQPHMAAGSFAAHCQQLMATVLNGGDVRGTCETDGMDYVAHHFRWLEPMVALERGGDADGPHPDTASWQQRFQEPVPGHTRAEQLAAVSARFRAAVDDRRTSELVAFGTRQPSTIETVVGDVRTGADWVRRLKVGLEPFGVTWPLDQLAYGKE